MKPKLLRVDQVLELLNISRGKLYRLLKNEPLFPRPIKLGGMLYFIPEEIDEFVNLQRRVEFLSEVHHGRILPSCEER